MRKIFLITLLTIFVTSCGIHTTYRRPELKVDEQYRGSSSGADDTTSLGSMPWRKLFTDTILQQHIELGLVSNTDLKIAKLRVEQAEATLRASRLSFLPSVSFDPQASISNSGGASYQLALSANWEIDIFGKLNNLKQGAKASLQQSHAYRQAVQTQLVATIANSYYTLLMLDGQVEVSQLTAQNWSLNVKTMRALKQAGRTTQAAVAQAEANQLAVQSSLLALGRQVNEMENSLSTLLGQSPSAIRRGRLAEQRFPQHVSIGIPIQLLSNRPDVRQAEYALTKAFYSTNAARAAFYPSISLGGSAGWLGATGEAIVNPSKMIFSALGSLVQPIFNRGANVAQLKIAKAQQNEAMLNFQQSLLEAGAQVNNSLVEWQTAREQIKINGLQIKALETAVNGTQMLMQHGSTTYLEVLTAQQSLLQAELSQLTNRFGEIQGVINLYHSLGGGA